MPNSTRFIMMVTVILVVAGLAASSPESAWVAASGVKLFPISNASAKPVARLAKGTKITILQRKSGWIKIRVGSSKGGWVREKDLVFSRPKETLCGARPTKKAAPARPAVRPRESLCGSGKAAGQNPSRPKTVQGESLSGVRPARAQKPMPPRSMALSLGKKIKTCLVWIPGAPPSKKSGEQKPNPAGAGGDLQPDSRGFWLGQRRVTLREWKAVMGGLHAKFSDDGRQAARASRAEVREFLRKVGQGVRLPTEEEWSRAAGPGESKGAVTRQNKGSDEADKKSVNANRPTAGKPEWCGQEKEGKVPWICGAEAPGDPSMAPTAPGPDKASKKTGFPGFRLALSSDAAASLGTIRQCK